MAHALIICPTFDHQDTLYPTLESVRRQTFQDFEVVVIGDGAPPRTAEIMADIGARDPRFSYQRHPKHERTGEPHRDPLIRASDAQVIAYIGDDDLWLPWHLEWMVGALREHDFAHSMHYMLNPDGHVQAIPFQFASPALRERIVARGTWCFGLSYAAHTRDAYLRLDEGWTTTRPGIATDLNMWAKFGERTDFRTWEMLFPTALHLHSQLRRNTPPAERAAEAGRVLETFDDPAFLDRLFDRASFAEHFRYLFEPVTPTTLDGLDAVFEHHAVRPRVLDGHVTHPPAEVPEPGVLYARQKAFDALDLLWRHHAGHLDDGQVRRLGAKLLARDPGNHDLRLQLVELELDADAPQAALELAGAYEPGATAGKYAIALARAQLACEQPEAALATLDRLLQDDENNAWLHFLRGRALSAMDRDAEAVPAYQACVALDPGQGWAHFALGRHYLQTGRPADARRHLLAALEGGVPEQHVRPKLARIVPRS
ncbi:MAG: glycosyltransferase, partial [Xanthomonadales bacterium]|nr:glycosyltransferase [Xanthomonadales bacterium]